MNGSTSISRWLTALICLGLLISGSAADLSKDSTAADLTMRKIERLYNEVLESSINSFRQKMQSTKNYSSIDKQYFEMLDKAHNESYYSTAYLIFSLIHDDWLKGHQSDEVLQQLLPEEKVSIRAFFSKARHELAKYSEATQTTNEEILQYVSRWQTETADSIIGAYMEFPSKLRETVPELQLMDYMAQGRIIIEAVAQAFGNAIHALLTPRKSLRNLITI
ncbi:PREDICTED: uncharacterized protein LOC108610640 [Drosophila arizonae]|uniref:Uncharacterized protein LOC108610640 n=1 Tax=Drosophila arizonae TaxID=7263 RepID=A0ABM1NTQ2_DROAR|nr:PREDICTED: uncharacterized protein LOC108610640 [Drosophila arizonae]